MGVFAAASLCGCLSASNYGTAKMLGKGRLEAAPSYTQRYIFSDLVEDVDIRRKWSESYGIALTYGMTASAGIRLKAERFNSIQGGDPTLLELEPKFEVERMRSAVSFPLGYYPTPGVYQAGARAFSNFYLNRTIYYCISPSILFSGRNAEDWTLSGIFANNVTLEFFNRIYIRPEAGIEIVSLFLRSTNVNAGISAGIMW